MRAAIVVEQVIYLARKPGWVSDFLRSDSKFRQLVIPLPAGPFGGGD